MKPNLKTTEKLFKSIEMVFGTNMDEVRSISRIRPVTDARKAIIYFLKTHFNMRPHDMAIVINKHRSVMGYMFDCAEFLIRHDEEFRKKIDRIKSSTEIGTICPCCQRPF